MSVDTYLKRKNTAGYHLTRQEGVEVLVSPRLARQVKSLHLGLKRSFLWHSLYIEAEAKGHVHGPE